MVENVSEREEARDQRARRAGKNGDWVVRRCGKWQHGPQRGVGEHVLRLNALTCDAFALPKGLLPPTAPPHHGKSISLMTMLGLWGLLHVGIEKANILPG